MMEGFGLFVGHLVGDYILQNDRQAKNKTSSHFWCAVHVCLYTFAMLLCNAWWLPWWAYPVIAVTHYPVDRWRLARVLMRFNGQEEFATGPMAPWSIVAVDQVIHAATLYGLLLAIML